MSTKVQNPGSRGGKFRIADDGDVRYGPAPSRPTNWHDLSFDDHQRHFADVTAHRKRRVANLVQDTGEHGGVVKIDNDHFAVLTRDMSGQGKYRATRFDHFGPAGHQVGETADEALEKLIGSTARWLDAARPSTAEEFEKFASQPHVLENALRGHLLMAAHHLDNRDTAAEIEGLVKQGRFDEAQAKLNDARKPIGVIAKAGWWLLKARGRALPGQLSLFGDGHVMRPGIRGGQFWYDDAGKVRYGEKPKASTPKAPESVSAPKEQPEDTRNWASERFEHIECSRCAGRGRIAGFGHVRNGVCFKCGGNGRKYTARGEAAFAYYRDLLKVRAADLVPGQKILTDGVPGYLAGDKIEVKAIEVGDDGAVTIHGYSPTFRQEEVLRYLADDKLRVEMSVAEKLPYKRAALEYQDTLTKQGKVRKDKKSKKEEAPSVAASTIVLTDAQYSAVVELSGITEEGVHDPNDPEDAKLLGLRDMIDDRGRMTIPHDLDVIDRTLSALTELSNGYDAQAEHVEDDEEVRRSLRGSMKAIGTVQDKLIEVYKRVRMGWPNPEDRVHRFVSGGSWFVGSLENPGEYLNGPAFKTKREAVDFARRNEAIVYARLEQEQRRSAVNPEQILGKCLLLKGRVKVDPRQLGFSFAVRGPVKAPGSRGGKFYRTDEGEIRYGERPQAARERAVGAFGGGNVAELERRGLAIVDGWSNTQESARTVAVGALSAGKIDALKRYDLGIVLAEESQDSAKITTPGTRVVFDDLAGWLDGWNEIHERKVSSQRYAQEGAHVLALTQPIIEAADDPAVLESVAMVVKDVRGLPAQRPQGMGGNARWDRMNAILQAVNNQRDRVLLALEPWREQPKRPKPSDAYLEASREASKMKGLAAKLRQKADAMQSAIDYNRDPAIASLNVTARRARIAGGMFDESQRLARIQKVLYEMADQAESGELPGVLRGVTNRAQVEMLLSKRYARGKENSRIPRAGLWSGGCEYLIREAKDKRDIAILEGVQRRLKDSMSFTELTPKEAEAAKRVGKGFRTYERHHLSEIMAHDRVGKMGIQTDEEWQEARALVAGMAAKANTITPEQRRLKDLERSLIGLRIPGYFPTPKDTVADMLDLARIKPGDSVLEPSAGKGSIAEAIRDRHPDAKLTVGEYSATLRDVLEAKGFTPEYQDFLEHQGEYDVIVMNPPFERGQDVAHVMHAFALLKPGGRLVAIMGEHAFFAADKQSARFRDWSEGMRAEVRRLPDGTFLASDRPTGVRTRMVVIEKPETLAKAVNHHLITVHKDGPDSPGHTLRMQRGGDRGVWDIPNEQRDRFRRAMGEKVEEIGPVPISDEERILDDLDAEFTDGVEPRRMKQANGKDERAAGEEEQPDTEDNGQEQVTQDEDTESPEQSTDAPADDSAEEVAA